MNVDSTRRTLLCYLTLCLSLYLLILFLFVEIFSREIRSLDKNQTMKLNLIKYRLSLIECGKSFVFYENLHRIVQQSNEFLSDLNRTKLFVDRDDLIISLEVVLSKCLRARLFSLIEQEKPTILRRLISFFRREFLYIASFFY